MNPTPILFWILMAMVIAWFGMITALFQRLESKHPEKYKEMGEPHLIRNNTIKTNWTTLRFLCMREHKNLHDTPLSLLSDFMLAFFIVYMILLIDLFAGVLPDVQLPAKP